MKKLILIRHAKSSWSSGAGSDNSRPLNERGHAASRKIGRWLLAEGLVPDTVLSSDATRCAQTYDGILEALGTGPTPEYNSALYLAGPEMMLATLQTASGDTVMMLGHMPGIGEFARDLRRDPPPAHEAFRKYPTGAVTVLDFKADSWRDIQMGTGKIVAYTTPRALP
ncbi:MAG: histidine phosphatase family protein [Rhodobacteraceae bacterium]|nr:histidine phosphatase family protein [Paracoccaceae bacterium]